MRRRPEMVTRVVLVDDHEIVRVGLRSVLDSQPDIEVVGEAADGREAIDVVDRHLPDVVLMDIAMPNLNGIDATLRIKESHPKIKVIILSMHLERAYVAETLRAGASGYVLKERAVDEMLPAIKTARTGRTYLSPGVTDLVLQGYLEAGAQVPDSAFSNLTEREREVLQFIAEGKSMKEIAGILHLSPKTVETHKRRIMDRLDIRTVAGLTRYAIRNGLVSD
jgi:two-component system, NarL family, response regulator NreC